MADYRSSNKIDFVIANGENAAGGAGITAKTANEILDSGVDAITLGDHVRDQMNFHREIDELNRVCRPANLPNSNPGRDRLILEHAGLKIGLFTVLGRTYMKPKVCCPFETSSTMVEQLKNEGWILSLLKSMEKQLLRKKQWVGTWMVKLIWFSVLTPMFLPLMEES